MRRSVVLRVGTALAALLVLTGSLHVSARPAAGPPRPGGPLAPYDPPSTAPTPTPFITPSPDTEPYAVVTHTEQACSEPPGPWAPAAPLPAVLFGSAVAGDGVYVYSAGGQSTSVSNQLLRYDPVANSWTTLAPLTVAVHDALAVYAEGKIFLFGGDDGAAVRDDTQIYTIATNTWAIGAPMPGARQQMAGGYSDGKIYVAAGYDSQGVTPQNQLWEYSLAANSWAAKTDVPAPLGGPGYGVVDGHLYVLGGRDSGHAALTTVRDYDIAAGHWASRPDLPTGVNRPGSAVYRGRIWLIGGGDPLSGGAKSPGDAPSTTGLTQIFDPVTDAWLPGPALGTARSFLGAASVRNRLVAVGGYDGSSAVAAVEVATQRPLRIVLLYADARPPWSLQLQLRVLPGVGAVDVLDARASAPTLAELQPYDVVVPFSDYPWLDPDAIGDILADYEDGGGIVVALNFDWYAGAYAIGGRWAAEGYSPFALGPVNFSDGSLGDHLPGHPLLAGVSALSGYYRAVLPLAAGATQVAAWDDGTPLLAYTGRAAAMSAYLGDNPAPDFTGEFAAVIVNAGYWLLRGDGPCPQLVCRGPVVISGSIAAGDAWQTGRLNRYLPPSSCPAPEPCPGLFSSTPVRYDAYPFVNNAGTDQCVTVALDADGCTGANYIFSEAYLGNYDPGNLCSNYLGDIGASPEPTGAYSVTVPAGQPFTVVVNEVTADAGCPSYVLSVSADDCPAPPAAYVPVTTCNSP